MNSSRIVWREAGNGTSPLTRPRLIEYAAHDCILFFRHVYFLSYESDPARADLTEQRIVGAALPKRQWANSQPRREFDETAESTVSAMSTVHVTRWTVISRSAVIPIEVQIHNTPRVSGPDAELHNRQESLSLIDKEESRSDFSAPEQNDSAQRGARGWGSSIDATGRRETVADDFDVMPLIRACVDTDEQKRKEARKQFQELFGESIYNWMRKIPTRNFRKLSEDEVTEFYLWLMDDRLFRRIQNFKNRSPFPAYLMSILFVGARRPPIPSLFQEWLRERAGKEEPDTTSLDATEDYEDGENHSRLEKLTDKDAIWPTDPEPQEYTGPYADCAREVYSALPHRDQLLLKLFRLIENTLTNEDYEELAKWSRRERSEVEGIVAHVMTRLINKEERLSALRDKFERVSGDILFEEQHLQQIRRQLSPLPLMSPQRKKLLQGQTETEERRKRLYGQLANIKEEIRRFVVTTPYKDLAELLNLSMGAAGAMIAHLRQRLLAQWEACLSAKGVKR